MLKGRRLLSIVLTCVFLFSLTACSGGGDNKKDTSTTAPTTKAEDTTKESTTKEPETTTEEPTTEKPTYSKEMSFTIRADKKDMFDGLIVEKGYKFVINDIMPEGDGFDDHDRGMLSMKVAYALFRECTPTSGEISDIVYSGGSQLEMLSTSQNLVIEYVGSDKLVFELDEVKEVTKHDPEGNEIIDDYAYFIVHPVE
ncbi:MAG: hypothetical protein IJC76_03755 [Lachnospiraceae bacterium]|nr:hypothetical protein [Lachnospiraceae bacterium]